MAFELFNNSGVRLTAIRALRWLVAGVVAAAIAGGASAFAANNSVQGAKKDDGGYDTDAPTAILIEA
ncbi:MAG TPA: D-alanyl-D-alanine carboxypeptidase, partial [Bradyrhizobium sp.]|nr:D-alanyl-D-alanine carboxypeptidase [Bradyrhizobium sp.]